MQILTVDNECFVLNKIPDQVDEDLRFSVLDYPKQRVIVNAPPMFRRAIFLLGGAVGFVVADFLVELLRTLS